MFLGSHPRRRIESMVISVPVQITWLQVNVFMQTSHNVAVAGNGLLYLSVDAKTRRKPAMTQVKL